MIGQSVFRFDLLHVMDNDQEGSNEPQPVQIGKVDAWGVFSRTV